MKAKKDKVIDADDRIVNKEEIFVSPFKDLKEPQSINLKDGKPVLKFPKRENLDENIKGF